MIASLEKLLTLLNLVEVKGEQNLVLLASAISTLKEMHSSLTKNRDGEGGKSNVGIKVDDIAQ
jgi:hypothetical protein